MRAALEERPDIVGRDDLGEAASVALPLPANHVEHTPVAAQIAWGSGDYAVVGTAAPSLAYSTNERSSGTLVRESLGSLLCLVADFGFRRSDFMDGYFVYKKVSGAA